MRGKKAEDTGRIILDDNFFIEVDDYNYSLRRVKRTVGGKNPGTEYIEPKGYFNSLVEALEAYGRECVRLKLQQGHTDLTGAVQGVLEANEHVIKIIRSAVPYVHVCEA